jgi:ribonuclease P protein component
LERLNRLTRPADFDRVRREGRSWAGRMTVLVTLQNGLEHSRIGFAAGKRVGGAVQRNRAKRLLREAVRAYLRQIQAGWDMVWLARTGMARAAMPEVRSDVGNLLRRARLMLPDSN